MKSTRILYVILLLAGTALTGSAKNVFARKSLTSISVDQLGEDEILLLKQSFENKNISPNEALNQLKSRGNERRRAPKAQNTSQCLRG